MDSQVKKRAVIYCRVSTQEQVQKDALKIQVEEARKCVRENGWILVDEYIEMESGTTKSGRTEYMRLLSDMETKITMEKRFDVIVIKSLDRLNRCAKDWYLFLEELSAYDKLLYIYMDRKFYQAEDNLISGIKAILAEQYSRELSCKINNAHRYRQKNGTAVLLNNNTYGYRKNADKSVSIVPEEAEMIRCIFQLAAQGRGAYSISNLLFKQGVRNRNGNQLGESTIRRIIRNPLFKGTVVMNRKHFDFEKKKIIENSPSEWIIHEGMVPAIVEVALWEKANKMLGRFSKRGRKSQRNQWKMEENKESNEKDDNLENGNNDRNNDEIRSKKKKILYNFSRKIVCGVCGAPYYKTFRRRGKNKAEIVIEWKCSRYLKHGKNEKYGCDNIFLVQKKLELQMEEESEKYLFGLNENTLSDWIIALLRDLFIQTEKESKGGSLEETSLNTMLKKRKDSLEKKQKRLLELLLEDVVKEDVYREKMHELQQEHDDVEKKLVRRQEDSTKNMETAGNPRSAPDIKEIEKKLFSGGIRMIKTEYFLLKIQKIKANKTGISIDMG